jgi:hypothetical protein
MKIANMEFHTTIKNKLFTYENEDFNACDNCFLFGYIEH